MGEKKIVRFPLQFIHTPSLPSPSHSYSKPCKISTFLFRFTHNNVCRGKELVVFGFKCNLLHHCFLEGGKERSGGCFWKFWNLDFRIYMKLLFYIYLPSWRTFNYKSRAYVCVFVFLTTKHFKFVIYIRLKRQGEGLRTLESLIVHREARRQGDGM